MVRTVSCLEKPFLQLKRAAEEAAAAVVFKKSTVPLTLSRMASVPTYKAVQTIVWRAYLKPLRMPPYMTR